VSVIFRFLAVTFCFPKFQIPKGRHALANLSVFFSLQEISVLTRQLRASAKVTGEHCCYLVDKGCRLLEVFFFLAWKPRSFRTLKEILYPPSPPSINQIKLWLLLLAGEHRC
jgi:hypothetical protein